jgi:hypothetical protein
MNTRENDLHHSVRDYQHYLLAVEWSDYLTEKQAQISTNSELTIHDVIIRLTVLQDEKKRLFIKAVGSFNRSDILEQYQTLVSTRDRPFEHIRMLLKDQQQKVLQQEMVLLSAVNWSTYCLAQLALVFTSQPSFQWGAMSIKPLANNIATNVELDQQDIRLLQNCTGTAYVILPLVTALSTWYFGFSGSSHYYLSAIVTASLAGYYFELTAAFNRTMINQINCLLSLSDCIDKLMQYSVFPVIELVPCQEETKNAAIDFLRWDNMGFIEKEPFVCFLFGLAFHMLLSLRARPLVAGMSYSLTMMMISGVTRLINYLFPGQSQDTHLYTDNEINDLLVHYGKDSQLTLCLTCMLGTTSARGNDLLDNLKDYIANREMAVSNGGFRKNKVVIPVNLNQNHWVLLYLLFDNGAVYPKELYYYDPLGKPMPDDIINIIFFRRAEVSLSIDVPVQTDGYTCGTWVVYFAQQIIEHGRVELDHIDIAVKRTEQMSIIYPKANPHTEPNPFINTVIHIGIYIFAYSYFFTKIDAFLPVEAMQNGLTQEVALSRLGLFSGATKSEIKKAHRDLALELHPDKNKNNETASVLFIEMKEAFEFLTNKP